LFGQQEGQAWLSDHLARQFQSFSVGKGEQQFLGGHDLAEIFYKLCRRRISPEIRWNAAPDPICLRNSALSQALNRHLSDNK
jgi:hypothetical protein